jgi:hypothetical protein
VVGAYLRNAGCLVLWGRSRAVEKGAIAGIVAAWAFRDAWVFTKQGGCPWARVDRGSRPGMSRFLAAGRRWNSQARTPALHYFALRQAA